MDYGHEMAFGAFVTPSARDPRAVVALARLAEGVGYDLLTFQDHPYQPAFLDTWTLLSYVAAATERITLAPNVASLPLRPPLVLARSAASLDLLSGGRVELGVGAGAFWEAIEASGGPRRTPGEAVRALEEAIDVLRQVWAAGDRGGVRVEGQHYRVVGAKRGPAPAHDIGIWVGAYKPAMLRLTGRLADGWLPSLGYLPGGAADLASGNAVIDEAARDAGREPGDVRRLLNIGADVAAEDLAEWALAYGVSVFIVGSDDAATLERFAVEVAPDVRAIVAAERAAAGRAADEGSPAAEGSPGQPVTAPLDTETARRLASIPTRDDGVRRSTNQPWDETTRPTAPGPPPGTTYRRGAEALGQHLVDVHDHLRGELATVRDLVEQVRAGTLASGAARSAINAMTMRQNDWTLGAYCAAYCRVVTGHHTLEDAEIFPHLRRADRHLEPVIDRLAEEHVVIHEVLEGLDRALVEFLAGARPTAPGAGTGHDPAGHDVGRLDAALDLLSDTLLSHLAYEEQQLVEPLARFGFYPGQL
ncbi:MAG TPA: LLM class flavin-dependent oxidoreductase [Actinomycetes bacterium]|nr:LLM class flavin-dependent oxidoreductase [Actinomycetes bacterium]